MKLSDIGEFKLIERLSKLVGKSSKPVVVGIGDDCAVIQLTCLVGPLRREASRRATNYLLLTTDTLIENVHFKIPKGTANSFAGSSYFYKLGHKAMLANISDIAAMGGVPTYALVTIGAPRKFSVKAIEKLYQGMKKHKIPIIGGDTVRSPKELIISITLLGEVEKKCLLLRSGAKVGDAILVMGKFGGEAARKYRTQNTEHRTRITEARLIAKTGLANSMIDSSDGLVRSISEICRASKVSAKIDFDKVPIAKGASLKQALFGGEEYELVFTASKSKAAKLAKLIPNVSIVGRIIKKGKGNLPKGGFEHFK